MRSMSLTEMIDLNKRHGGHWFDADTMRFFRSRVLGGGCDEEGYFVSSEKFVTYYPRYHEEPRRYTVRRIDDEGHVTEVGEFQAYATARAARRAIERLRKGVKA